MAWTLRVFAALLIRQSAANLARMPFKTRANDVEKCMESFSNPP
jgi:hypothetical protein